MDLILFKVLSSLSVLQSNILDRFQIINDRRNKFCEELHRLFGKGNGNFILQKINVHVNHHKIELFYPIYFLNYLYIN